jgi:hypothetical protein
MKLAALATGFARLDIDAVANAALARQAEAMAGAVRETLSKQPGEAHVFPWMRTGTLHDSIEVVAEGAEAVIGSSDPVALWQEHGTPHLPPRPFLAPMAEQGAASVASAIGSAVATALSSIGEI